MGRGECGAYGAGIALAGVPDRYVRRQTAIFTCNECQKPGDPARESMRTITDQKVDQLCPHCGAYLLEDRVVHYSRRSGGLMTSADLWGGHSDLTLEAVLIFRLAFVDLIVLMSENEMRMKVE